MPEGNLEELIVALPGFTVLRLSCVPWLNPALPISFDVPHARLQPTLFEIPQKHNLSSFSSSASSPGASGEQAVRG